MNSIMRLEKFQLEHLSVSSKPPGSAVNDDAHYRLTTAHAREVSRPAFPLRLQLEIDHTADAPSTFSRVEATCNGLFVFPDDAPEEVIRRYYPKLAVAGLLGVLRGAVAQSTAMFSGGPYLIPLLDLSRMQFMDEAMEQQLFPSLAVGQAAQGQAAIKKPKRLPKRRV